MESTPFSSLLTATATTANGTMTRSSTPTVGGRSAMGLLVTELIVQRLPAGFAAGKQTSRILLRNGSEPYSRQAARARRRADRISTHLLRCIQSFMAHKAHIATSPPIVRFRAAGDAVVNPAISHQCGTVRL